VKTGSINSVTGKGDEGEQYDNVALQHWRVGGALPHCSPPPPITKLIRNLQQTVTFIKKRSGT
jgi:hypothetical protein